MIKINNKKVEFLIHYSLNVSNHGQIIYSINEKNNFFAPGCITTNLDFSFYNEGDMFDFNSKITYGNKLFKVISADIQHNFGNYNKIDLHCIQYGECVEQPKNNHPNTKVFI